MTARSSLLPCCARVCSLSFELCCALLFVSLQSDEDTPLSYPSWVDVSTQLSKPLIGGPRSYYLALFNDDTVSFEHSRNYPEQGEAERVDREQRDMRQAIADVAREDARGAMSMLRGGEDEEESKEAPSSRGRARAGAMLRSSRVRGGGARLAMSMPLPMPMQEAVLMEPEVLRRADTITIRKLLREGVGFQPGDLQIGQQIATALQRWRRN